MTKIIGTGEFDSLVLKSDKPVLVDFYADWCGPCKMMSPIIEQIDSEKAGEISVYKVNVDSDGSLAAQYGIMSIPTMIVFKDGNPVDRVTGALSKQDLLAKLDRV